MSKKMLTDAERQERREADRQKAHEAVEALRSSDGWQRWLALRRCFHSYSFSNQLLIALQLPEATRVAGFKAWLKLGYCVKRGSQAIRIWVPMPPTKTDLERWAQNGAVAAEKPRTRFRLGPVFDRSQVQELPPPAEPVALDPPIVAIAGDELAWSFEPLVALATEVGVTVALEAMPADRGGYYQPGPQHIGLNDQGSVNQRVKTLVHELGHALKDIEKLDTEWQLSYAEEELVVESVAYTVCGTLGLDSAGYSIPYLASWSQEVGIDTIERTARLIDEIAKRIEDAVNADVRHEEAVAA